MNLNESSSNAFSSYAAELDAFAILFVGLDHFMVYEL